MLEIPIWYLTNLLANVVLGDEKFLLSPHQTVGPFVFGEWRNGKRGRKGVSLFNPFLPTLPHFPPQFRKNISVFGGGDFPFPSPSSRTVDAIYRTGQQEQRREEGGVMNL